MSRLSSALFVLYVAVLFYLGYMNHQGLELVLYPGRTKEMPLWMFAFLCSLAGAILVFVLYVVRDTKRFISSLKAQKKQKRTAKLQEQFSKALTAVNMGRTEEAKELLEALLSEEPDHRDATIRLAEIYEMEGDLGRAEALLATAHENNPTDIELALFLARLRLQNGKAQQALVSLDRVLDRQPLNISGLVLKREILEMNGKWQELIDLQKQILSIKKNQEENLRLLGYMHEFGMERFRNGDPKGAIEIFREVLKEEKDQVFAATHLALAEVMYSEGKVPEGIDYLEEVFKRTGSLIILAKLEELLLERSSPSRLLEIYREALERWPDNEVLKFFLGKLYYRLEMLDDAIALLSEIDEEKVPHVRKIKGMIYLRRGQADEAAAEFRKALDIKNTLRVPYRCSSCGSVRRDYPARCPACGTWNSYCFEIEDEVCVF